MAWDALSSIFKKKDEEGQDSLKQNYAPGSASASAGSVKTNAGDYSSFYGQGGSQGGGPVSAGFVNFGTMYDLNKDKAAKQADAIQSKAAGAAQNAQTHLQGAQSAFGNSLFAGTGKGPARGNAQGRFGTQITPPAVTGGTSVAAGASGQHAPDENAHDSVNHPQEIDTSGASRGITAGAFSEGIQKDEAAQRQADLERQAQAARNRGAAGKSGVYGQLQGGQLLGEKVSTDPSTMVNNISELDAKSGAGQQYTGPESLKASMGDDAYGALSEELRKAEEGTQALNTDGGLATALGYGPDSNQGNSALDTGLTQTAGRQQFKALANKWKGLSGRLADAQTDSEKSAAGATAASDAAAKEWQDMLDQYEQANAKTDVTDKPATITQVDFSSNNDKNPDGTYKIQTNANKITTGGYGYTATDVQDAVDSGVLTSEEIAFLNGSNIADTPVIGGLADAAGSASTGYNSASMMANILEKLRRWKEGEK